MARKAQDKNKKKMLDRIRRIRGQVEAIESAVERDADCSEILHTISACRGAVSALMAKTLERHIRFHVIDPDRRPDSDRSKATRELIEMLRAYVN